MKKHFDPAEDMSPDAAEYWEGFECDCEDCKPQGES